MVQNVFTSQDFNSLLDNYFGREISYYPVVQTLSNITGEETLTEGAEERIKVHFVRYNQSYTYEKAGFKQHGDAIMLSKVSDAVQVNDVVIVDSIKYRVKERFDVPGVFDSTGTGTLLVYTAVNLFIDEE